MIDKAYFDTHLHAQFEKLGSARIVVVLHNGTTFHVQRVEQTLDQYVLLAVYPNESDEAKARELRQKGVPHGTKDVFWDRVAVPYEAINHVWLSLTEPA